MTHGSGLFMSNSHSPFRLVSSCFFCGLAAVFINGDDHVDAANVPIKMVLQEQAGVFSCHPVLGPERLIGHD